MKNDDDNECNRDGDLDMLLCAIVIVLCLLTPFVMLVIDPIVSDFASERYYDSLLSPDAIQFDVFNGEIVVIDYSLREGTYKLKPLEGCGSYIQTAPPFNDFVANDLIRSYVFYAERDSELSDGLVGLYLYGKRGIHVGRWVLGDIEYNPDAQPTVTVTLTENDTLRYDFVVPAPEYVTIGNLNVDEMRKYMGEK